MNHEKTESIWRALARRTSIRTCQITFFERYDLLINPYRSWGDKSRPMPDNMGWVTSYKRGYYDLAILHVDQQSIYDPDKGDRITKGKLFKEVRAVIGNDVPIVVINHMTPFHDKYESDYVVDYMKKLTDGCHVVVNSFEAAKQWGFGWTITHGMETSDWWDLPKEPRVAVVLTPAGMEKAYRRIFLHTVKRYLDEDGVPFVWVGVDKKCNSFDEYRDFLGRSLVFSIRPGNHPDQGHGQKRCFQAVVLSQHRTRTQTHSLKTVSMGFLPANMK